MKASFQLPVSSFQSAFDRATVHAGPALETGNWKPETGDGVAQC